MVLFVKKHLKVLGPLFKTNDVSKRIVKTSIIKYGI